MCVPTALQPHEYTEQCASSLWDATLLESRLRGHQAHTSRLLLWGSVTDVCSLHWESSVSTGRDFRYKMCSFITLGMACFLLFHLRAALRLHFIPNGQFIITFFSVIKENLQGKNILIAVWGNCANSVMISCDAKLHVHNT